LAWSLVAFAANPNEAKPIVAMPVDIISASELSQVTAGARNKPKLDLEMPKPKPLVEQVAPPKPVEDTTAKVATREIKTAAEQPPAAAPPPKPPAPVQKTAEPKRDLIAEALKKDEARKPEPKPAEQPKQQPAPKSQPMFDPRQLQALLDKRAAQRVAAAGETRNEDVSLGAVNGAAAQLSQSEIDALRKRLEECWTPPIGVDSSTRLNVVIRVLFNNDGSVAKPPDVVAGPASPLGPAMAESAKRAILRCQPFKMLKPEHYEQWKDIEINFDPQQMLRG
jgi:colicin import membrane protein